MLLEALRARAGGFLGAASLPRHLRRRATSHCPRNRRAKRPNAKRAKLLDDAGFAAAAAAAAAPADASLPAPLGTTRKGASRPSRYWFAIESVPEVRWCRRARRRPERARLANRERLARDAREKASAKTDDEPARDGDGDDSFSFSPPLSRASDVAWVGARAEDTNDDAAHWRRLETHAWHAKRFALVRRWGWRLPLGAPGKGRGWRETMRRAAEGALAHDASYHPAFVVRFDVRDDADDDVPVGSRAGQSDGNVKHRSTLPPVALELIETLTGLGRDEKIKSSRRRATATLFRSAAFAAGGVSVDATLTNESGESVSPATFVVARSRASRDGETAPRETQSKTPNFVLWVWTHAAARDEAFEAVSAATRSDRFSERCSARPAGGRLCRFELVGARAASVLETLAGNLTLLRERDGGVTPRGARSFQARLDAKEVSSRRRARRRAAKPSAEANALLRREEESSNGGDSIPLLAAVAGDVFDGTSDAFSDGDRTKKVSLVAIRRAKPRGGAPGGADPGYTLLAPSASAHALWLALVALGARAAGSREWRWLAVAAGAPTFPEDFPASAAASVEAERALAETSAAASRTPAGKRAPDAVREGAARAATAFVRRAREENGEGGRIPVYARAVVRCFRGGGPKVGAAVLAATPAQRDALRRGGRGERAATGRASGPAASPSRGEDVGRARSSFDAVFGKKYGARAPDRTALARGCERQTVLGYVTSASAPGAARGVASAVVDVRALEGALAGVAERDASERREEKKERRGGVRFAREKVAPVALLAPTASPAAITPATLELIDDTRIDPVWW